MNLKREKNLPILPNSWAQTSNLTLGGLADGRTGKKHQVKRAHGEKNSADMNSAEKWLAERLLSYVVAPF